MIESAGHQPKRSTRLQTKRLDLGAIFHLKSLEASFFFPVGGHKMFDLSRNIIILPVGLPSGYD